MSLIFLFPKREMLTCSRIDVSIFLVKNKPSFGQMFVASEVVVLQVSKQFVINYD